MIKLHETGGKNEEKKEIILRWASAIVFLELRGHGRDLGLGFRAKAEREEREEGRLGFEI